MSTTQSHPEAETEASSTESDTQTSLFDTDTFQQSSEDALPEDITREFAIPAESPINLLDIPTDELDELLKMPWEQMDAIPTETPAWSGVIDTELLEIVIGHLTPTIKETRIHINEDGWLISVVDSANVAMYRIWISAADFTKYDCQKHGVAGINLDDLTDTLSHIDGDTVTININDTTRTITIDDGAPVEFNLIDPDSIRQSPEIPEIDINQQITLPGGELKSLFDRLSEFSDHLKIESITPENTHTHTDADTAADADADTDTDEETTPSVEVNTMRFVADGDVIDADKVYQTAEHVDTVSHRQASRMFEMDINDTVDSLFSFDYLTKFITKTSTRTIQPTYEITIGDEYPTKIYSDIDGCDQSHIMFMLAPRIQS
jgi:proliferating cell nuclear antigen